MRRLAPRRAALLLIDVQDRLYRTLPDDQRRPVLDHLTTLRLTAQRLDLPVVACELDPRAHGRTIPQLGGLPVVEHTRLSAASSDDLGAQLGDRDQVVLAGLETHLAVAQTALDLLDRGLGVWLVVDACLDRRPRDAEVALARLARAGAWVTSTSATLFEWVDHVHDPLYQELVRAHHR
ncbi:MAG TPA: isochorismatase family protein [Myxococcota bacterium]|nr:isochorismatase family protein [Myxococcota bacterium]